MAKLIDARVGRTAILLVVVLQAVIVSGRGLAADQHAATVFGVDPPPLAYAGAAALLEVESDTVLFAHNGDEAWAPASLTKLVTIYAALEAYEEGTFALDQPLPVDPRAYASAVPPGSSLMFLGPDQVVSGMDLLRGLAISSGNDASVEVALRVSGSIGAFNARMNDLVRRLGYEDFYFEDPAGLSPANRISAMDFARFSADMLTRWPWLTEELFGLREFSYPRPVHYPGGMPGGSIRQFNRNGLVGTYPGVDGLKTGFIDESGYNLAVSATRNGRRLIAVVLGVEADSHAVGGQRREADAAALLDWGFSEFETRRLTIPPPYEVTLWGADRRSIVPIAAADVLITIPAGSGSQITGTIEQETDVWAPVAAGTVVGSVSFRMNDTPLREVLLTIPDNVTQGGFFRRLVDTVRWWFRGVFRSTSQESY